MDTNNCGELQPGGKGQEPSWPPVNAPTPLLWRNESQGKDLAQGWWGTLNCPQERFAMLQHNIFISQQQLDVSHFPSQRERKRLSLQMGTKKLPLVHMAGQQRWWESSSLPEQHNLSSEEPLKLDFSRAAEWWTASWSFTNKWWGNEKSSVAWLSSKTV